MMRVFLLVVLFVGCVLAEGEPGQCESTWICSGAGAFSWTYPVCQGNSVPSFTSQALNGELIVTAQCGEGDTCVGFLSQAGGEGAGPCQLDGIGALGECLFGVVQTSSGFANDNEFTASTSLGGPAASSGTSQGVVVVGQGYQVVTDSRSCPGCTGFVCYDPSIAVTTCTGGTCTAVTYDVFFNVGVVPFVGQIETTVTIEGLGLGVDYVDATCSCPTSNGCDPLVQTFVVQVELN